MEFDERRIDLVKASIQNRSSGQKIVSKALDNKVHVHWPKEDEYLGMESILDHLTCDDANWSYTELGEVKVCLLPPLKITDKDKYAKEMVSDEQIDEEEAEEEEIIEKTIIRLKVNTRKDEAPLVELALTHPESHVRIAAIKKIENNAVLCSIIVNDEDKTVKQASLDRLAELYIE